MGAHYASGNAYVAETSQGGVETRGKGSPPKYEVFTRCGTLEDSSPSPAEARTTPASWC